MITTFRWVRWAMFTGAGWLLAACASGATSPDSRPSVPPVETDTTAVYVPGQSYFDEHGYIEYIAGDLPIILSAPHGGDLLPASIPDRTSDRCSGSAVTVTDRNTRELVLAMGEALEARYGGRPHIVINHLQRRKLDANRALPEAACGDPAAARAWREFHSFLRVASESVHSRHGRGWYMDIHGHGHEVQRLELGYLLRGSHLDLDDVALNAAGALRDTASIGAMTRDLPLSEALRGARSLGAMYGEHGFRAVPSPDDPSPAGAAYFSGGYNTRRYACGVEATVFDSGTHRTICGVQIEANYEGVRDSEANRARFAAATAAILGEYLRLHSGIELRTISH